MHAHHQHLFIIRAVEDSDMPALRQMFGRTPQEIMLQFGLRRRLERVHLTALRIHSRHDVLDGAVFAGRVHGLKDQQHRPTVLGVEFVLQILQAGNVFLQVFLASPPSANARYPRDRSLSSGNACRRQCGRIWPVWLFSLSVAPATLRGSLHRVPGGKSALVQQREAKRGLEESFYTDTICDGQTEFLPAILETAEATCRGRDFRARRLSLLGVLAVLAAPQHCSLPARARQSALLT